MVADLLAILPEQLKKRASDSIYERMAYTHDMSPVEGFLTSDWLRATPDLVVSPQNTEEVSLLLSWAHRHQIAVTPRGGGSTSLFQSVPAKGGVLLDLNRLNSIGPWDLATATVQVGAGTVIYDLIREAEARGFTLATFPSSAPAGTLGGWFNNGGRGYGSLLHGSLLSQVSGAEVVFAGGQVAWLSADSEPKLKWFLGSEGSLGVITKLSLQLVPKPAAAGHIALGFSQVAELEDFLRKVLDGSFLPYNITFVSATPGGQTIQRINWDVMLPGNFLVASFFGSQDQVDQGMQRLKRLKSEYRVRQLPRWQAEKYWTERFTNFRLQRTGPSLLGAEVALPVTKIAKYVRGTQNLAHNQRKPMITFGYLTNRNEAYVTTMFWSDEARTVRYLLDISLVNAIYRAAFRSSAKPVGLGLWNSPYLHQVYSRKQRTVLRNRKRLLDPHGILNPGKTLERPVLLQPPLFTTGMATLRGIRWLISRLGRSES